MDYHFDIEQASPDQLPSIPPAYDINTKLLDKMETSSDHFVCSGTA